jgi:serine/threonine-protein kinase
VNLVAGATLGAYRIIAPIGRGGMATVYKAYQPGLSRYVAIKVLPSVLAEEAGFRERFKQEAVAIARLRHPNILTIFEYGEEQGVLYLITEYVDGGELSLQLGVPLPITYVVSMLAPIAAALDYAHARGIFHRDVKPANILLQRGGKPVLVDFGVAKLVDSSERLTRTGAVLGTPEYMAPEQALGQPFAAASDQYALAIVAFEMLTGRVPFTADTPVAVLLAHLQRPLPPPRSINPALSLDVEAVLLRGLAKRPEGRYASVSALTTALAGAGHVPLDLRAPGHDRRPLGAAGVAEPPTETPSVALTPATDGHFPRQALRWFALGVPFCLPLLVPLLLILAVLSHLAPPVPFAWLRPALVVAVAVLGDLGLAGVLAGVLSVAADRRCRDLAADVPSVYAALGRRLWTLIAGELLAVAVLLLLTLSVVGLPLGALFLLDWSLAGPVLATERRTGVEALRRSARLLRGSRLRALVTLLPLILAGGLLAALLRDILGRLTSEESATPAIGLASLVVVPCLAAAMARLFADCRAIVERDDPTTLTPSAAGTDGAAWQWPRQ